MEIKRRKEGSSLLTFLFGAAAGAGLALLMAPKAGREVREKIKDFSSDAMAKSKEYARTMQDKVKSMRDRGQSASEKGQETVDEQVEKYFDVPNLREVKSS